MSTNFKRAVKKKESSKSSELHVWLITEDFTFIFGDP